MPQIVAHRGFWWPDQRHQNHPIALDAALDRGWDVEVDVWGAHGEHLRVGHDRPETWWTVPKRTGNSRLFVHFKALDTWQIVIDALLRVGWMGHVSPFVSPDMQRDEKFLTEQMVVVTNSEALAEELKQSRRAIWAEQPDGNWVTAERIRAVQQDYERRIYVVCPELHGRIVDLGWLQEWREADGVVTDYPNLLARVLNPDDAVVHPVGAWW